MAEADAEMRKRIKEFPLRHLRIGCPCFTAVERLKSRRKSHRNSFTMQYFLGHLSKLNFAPAATG